MIKKAHPELKLRFLWLLIGYALVALIIYLSLTSNPVDIGMKFPYKDKVYHAFAYFVLMAWFAQIYHDKFQRNMLATILVFMGISLEYLQSFDPHRMTDAGDIVANVTGVALGFILALSCAKNCLLKIENMLH
jgi:VanZ family protein